MAELINLRSSRKRAKRLQDEERAQSNRLAHGQPKYLRKRDAAERAKADRDLDRHLIEIIKKGDAR
jgi:hypothetical protein